MRGSTANVAILNNQDAGTVNMSAPAGNSTTNMEKNMEPAKNPGSVVWLLVILGLYLVWDYVQNKSSLSDSLDAANVRANVHNLLVIGFGAVIFVNLFAVLLTKLAALDIPIISKTAGAILPLFHL